MRHEEAAAAGSGRRERGAAAEGGYGRVRRRVGGLERRNTRRRPRRRAAREFALALERAARGARLRGERPRRPRRLRRRLVLRREPSQPSVARLFRRRRERASRRLDVSRGRTRTRGSTRNTRNTRRILGRFGPLGPRRRLLVSSRSRSDLRAGALDLPDAADEVEAVLGPRRGRGDRARAVRLRGVDRRQVPPLELVRAPRAPGRRAPRLEGEPAVRHGAADGAVGGAGARAGVVPAVHLARSTAAASKGLTRTDPGSRGGWGRAGPGR